MKQLNVACYCENILMQRLDVVDDTFRKANELWESGQLIEALRLFESIAEEGDAGAQTNVGYFYDAGLGVPKNADKALFWYKKAAEQGSAVACSNIATLYRDTDDFQKAKAWFLKAIERGDGDAALELAKMYLKSRRRGRLQSAEKFLRIAKASKNITNESQHEVKSLLGDR